MLKLMGRFEFLTIHVCDETRLVASLYVYCSRASQWSGAAAVIVAYDITNANSFRNCAKWIDMLAESFGQRKLKGVSNDERMPCALHSESGSLRNLQFVSACVDIAQACCSAARVMYVTLSPCRHTRRRNSLPSTVCNTLNFQRYVPQP